MLITFGGLAIAVAFAPAVSRSSINVASSSGALGWLLFIGTSVHVATTGCIFVLPEARSVARSNGWSSWWVPSGVIASATLASAAVAPSRMTLVLLVIFSWQFWHYQKQNLGIVGLVASSHRIGALRTPERRVIKSAGAAGVLGLVAHPQLLGIYPYAPFEPFWVLGELLLLTSAFYGLALMACRSEGPRTAAFTAAFAMSLSFWTPMFLFESPYAAVGGMTIAHGLQYLLLTGLVLLGPTKERDDFVRVGLALSAALLTGALLSWSSHLHSAALPLRALFGAYVGVVMTHFVADRHLWRLREPSARTFLASRAPFLLPVTTDPVADGSADGIVCR